MEAFFELTKDIWDFLKTRKKYWLAPLIITLLLMAALIVFTQGSVIAKFLYNISKNKMEPSGLEPLTPCMPCRCSTS